MRVFAKLINGLSNLAIGYFLVNLLFGLSTISPGKSLLAIVFFYILGMVSARYLSLSPREESERALLFNKIHNQLIQALDKQAELVYVVVAKRIHPKAGVYYDVVTGTDLKEFTE